MPKPNDDFSQFDRILGQIELVNLLSALPYFPSNIGSVYDWVESLSPNEVKKAIDRLHLVHHSLGNHL